VGLPAVSLNRRNGGMALPDVLVGLVLFGLVGAAGTTMLLRATRFLYVERNRVALATAFDASLGFLDADLAEVAPGDLIAATPDAITYRAIRLDGHACLVSRGEVRIARSRLRASRLPQAGRDSLLVLFQTDSGPEWVASGIQSVSGAQCAAEPAIRLTGDSTALAGVVLPVPGVLPVKTFEVMEARLYYSGGRRWLGARSVSAGEGIQPLAGPFEAGARFELRDAAGLPATVSSAQSLLPLMEAERPAWSRSPSVQLDTVLAPLFPRNLAP